MIRKRVEIGYSKKLGRFLMAYSTILLAGGKGLRFKEQNQEYKAFIKFKGIPFVLSVLKQIPSSANDDIIIVTIKRHATRFMDLIEQYQFSPKPKLVFDEIPFQGPMIGVINGMQVAYHDGCLVVPCDAPLLKIEVLQELIKQFEQIQNTSAVIPRWPNGYIEPLTAIYRKSRFLEPCRRHFEQGERRLSYVLASIPGVRYVKIEQFRKVDPKLVSFFNVNTENDYLKLKALYKKILALE
ncbi:MAG: molybdenum cofactor guanylyltransferase [Candidatus Hodarchaeota archaeon]